MRRDESHPVRIPGRSAAAAVLVLLLATAAPPPAAFAEEQPSSFVLTAWTEQTGLPPGEILAMTQDAEGYLWLGTSAGLVRFDGATFVEWGSQGEPALPRGAVPALVGTRDGSLWVGLASRAGVVRIDGSRLVEYSRDDGAPAGPVSAMLQDRQGALWVGARGGLWRFQDERWDHIYRDGEVSSLFEDSGGRLWISTSVGVFTLAGDAMELRDPGAPYVQHFAEDREGSIWVTDVTAIVRRLDTSDRPAYASDVRVPQSGWRLQRDRHGSIWVAALGGGLLRLTGSGDALVERVAYEDVIAGAPRSLFYDSEHNLWVGLRPGGLLRLSESVVRRDVPLEGLTADGVRAIAASDDGSVWIGTGHTLHRFQAGTRRLYDVAQTRVLHAAPQGTVWVVTSHGIGKIEEDGFVPVAFPSSIRWDRMNAMTSDAHGTLWLCSADEGVMSWRDGVLRQFRDEPAIATRSCSYIYADRQGQIWIGFTGGGLAVHAPGSFLSFGTEDGLARGSVLAMIEDRAGALWVTTRGGVSRYRNGRFTTMSAENAPFSEIAAALVEDRQGFLWVGVNTGAGVIRFDPREMDNVALDARRQIEYRLFDVSDGLLGDVRPLIRGAAVRASDGRLWLATGRGVVIVDPERLPPGRRPVPPRIAFVAVDGRRIRADPELALPHGISTLRIDYTTVGLSAPSKLRFRYQLEGFDPEWVQAGPRRSAVYENLPAGRYRFRVSATNDGLWTESGVWEFSVAPPFFATTWFLVASGVGIMLVVAAAWWLRVGAIRKQYALVLEERARVSREIHDTLLQSLAAIGFELETVSWQLDTAPGPAREALHRVRRQIGHSIRETRDSIWGLRHYAMESRGLVDALRELVQNAPPSVRIDLTVSGRPRRCGGDVELQLLRICQEAVTNAIRHGRASDIQVGVDFRPREVALSVSDNGCGFVVDDHAAAVDMREHLGLLGMRERARRIRGQLRIASRPGAGTTIEVIAPAARE